MSDTVILAPTWRANFLGLLLVLLGGLFITTMTWVVRSVADDINPLQAGFMRYAFGTLLLLPMAFKFKATDLAPRLIGGHIIRSIVHAISVLLWFYAVTKISFPGIIRKFFCKEYINYPMFCIITSKQWIIIH